MPVRRLILALAILCLQASARNLDQRVGVGLSLTDFDQMGALSARYFSSPYFTLEGVFGFDTFSGRSATLLGGKVYRNAYLEENMNFYGGLAGLVIADKGGTATVSTGIEIDALFGAEFFFSGLPNLGFQLETGIGIRSLRETSLRSLGSGLAGLGIHYYF